MVGFDDGSEKDRRLNEEKDDAPEQALAHARRVSHINANLTGAADVTHARRLKENLGISFMGDTKVGPFEISEARAKELLGKPNPHGRPNSDVVRPWANGLDITRRPRHMWIVDFPPGTSESQAALYEAPFEYIKKHVKPARAKNNREVYRLRWWIHAEAPPDLRSALEGLARYMVTTRVAKYRSFVWLTPAVLPDCQLIAFARNDDCFFGVLHSRPHEGWARAMGTQLREVESGFRYTPTSCFETFPLPHASPTQQAAIADAARELDGLRQGWLSPPEDSIAPSELKKRTLTNLYNQRPTWLANAHRKLDEAVFAAYGWPESPDALSDAQIVGRLLDLNLTREPA